MIRITITHVRRMSGGVLEPDEWQVVAAEGAETRSPPFDERSRERALARAQRLQGQIGGEIVWVEDHFSLKTAEEWLAAQREKERARERTS